METKKVVSYGIIPVRMTVTGLEVLVIHMYGSAGGTHWSFPKGRPEVGETPIQSALRECREEVGLVPAHVWTNDPIVESYRFTYDGRQIDKTVTYFIGRIDVAEVTIQPSEIKEALWLPLPEVSERLTYPAAKEVLTQTVAVLTREGLI